MTGSDGAGGGEAYLGVQGGARWIANGGGGANNVKDDVDDDGGFGIDRDASKFVGW